MKRSFLKLLVLPLAFFAFSCSEDDPEPEIDCSTSTLIVSASSPESSGCLTTDGVVVASASGGTGDLMYSLNDGTPQADPQFNDLGPGEYTVKVTDGTICFTTADVQVFSGISYSSEVLSIIENSCAIDGCHDGSTGLPNFLEFNNVQSRADDVKARTQSGDMPRSGSLTADEIAMIACWVDDGAQNN